VRPHLKEFGQLKFKGSTGAGNITAAPWMAVFDPRLTKGATTGYYVVYLFSIDLKTITLCLAFGTTQFEKQFGGPAKAFPRMREAASRLQDLFRQLVPKTLSREPIQLGATPRDSTEEGYEERGGLFIFSAASSFRPNSVKLCNRC
jgi:5-methylcytosine-specific restriction protein A